MHRWKKWFFTILALAALLAVVYVAASFIFVDFFVDMLWYGSLGFQSYFWLKILYKYLVLGGASLLFFLIIFLNFWVASRYLGNVSRPGAGEAKRAPAKLVKAFRSGSMKVYAPLSIIMAVVLAVPLYRQWESALLYIFGPDAGVKDPVYNVDISYYLFSLPIYTHIQHWLVITVLALFAALAILYYLEKRILAAENQPLYKGAKIHLCIVIFLVFVIQAWGYILERHQLLYNSSHQPLFFGPGFTEMRVILPFIWMSAIFLLATAIALMIFVNTRKGFFSLVILCALFALSHGARNWEFVPRMVEKYIVKPNELSRQSKYISNSIEATLSAYKLSDVETRDYQKERSLIKTSSEQIANNLRNIPVWDRELLDDVYQQLQGIRPYYEFNGVDVGRYHVEGRIHQVYLAGREITLSKLSKYAKNWVNLHLKYTHGYGVVMTPAAQGGDEIMTWYIKDIPPSSEYGFDTKQPGIYYGLEQYPFIIAPNDIGELNYPGEQRDFEFNYDGEGGIPVSSLFQKLLFAIYFNDRNIFFTTKTNSKSRILIHRNIRDCFERLTPFFPLDRDPYMIVTPERLYWIQDAFTTSDWYPHAAPYENRFNYIRDAVKIVVDAFSGKITYYIADPSDPIVRAYSRMYPGLLKPLDEMPAQIRKHLRYPKDLFEIQMAKYAKYHQKNPETFYQDEDRWEFSQFYRQEDLISLKPYYLTLDLIEPDQHEFLLLTSMSPKGRDNLRALALVGCDGDNYGRIIVYSFPKGRQVYGPSQISALIDQDTRVAEQFTLWNQVGSEIKRGKMILFPLGADILYIQPVYLRAASKLKIPELKRLIVSQGDVVAMDSSLEQAFTRLGEALEKKLGHPSGEKVPPAEAAHQKPSEHGEPTKHQEPDGHREPQKNEPPSHEEHQREQPLVKETADQPDHETTLSPEKEKESGNLEQPAPPHETTEPQGGKPMEPEPADH